MVLLCTARLPCRRRRIEPSFRSSILSVLQRHLLQAAGSHTVHVVVQMEHALPLSQDGRDGRHPVVHIYTSRAVYCPSEKMDLKRNERKEKKKKNSMRTINNVYRSAARRNATCYRTDGPRGPCAQASWPAGRGIARVHVGVHRR